MMIETANIKLSFTRNSGGAQEFGTLIVTDKKLGKKYLRDGVLLRDPQRMLFLAASIIDYQNKERRTSMKPKPEGMTEEHFEFLDELRDSGETNMYGAAQYLTDEMGVPKLDAKKYLVHWMETFEARQA